MNWSAMVTDASEQLRTDHGLAQAAAESRAYDRSRMGVSFRQGHRTAWWQAVQWVLTQQLMWDDLTESEAIHELRKGSGSIYYPLFSADPKITADCPRDGRTVVDATGICDHCFYEFAKE